MTFLSATPASELRWQRLIITACAALLTACAVGPDYQRPAGPHADGYTPANLVTATASDAAGNAQVFVMGRDIAFAWWNQFQSARLNALVAQALQANPTISAAQAALAQAQEFVSVQRGFFYPTVGAGFSPQRQKVAGNLSSNAPGLQGNGSTIGGAQSGPVYYNFYTAQLSLSYAPDLFGGNRRQVESLQAQAQALRYQMEATYITLATNVVAAVIQAASLHSQISAAQVLVAQNAKALEILHQQSKLGYVMAIDVATQDAALAQAKALLPPLQKQLGQTRDLLRALCGVLPNEKIDDDFDLSELHLPSDLPLSLPSTLVEQRPDIRAAEEQLHAASAEVGVAIAARLPQLTMTGAFGGTASEIAQMFATGGGFWSLTGGITQTLFDGGILMHRERAADQALLQAQAQYRSTVIGAFQNVADTLHAIESDADALAVAVQAEQAAQVVQSISEKQYQLGYVNFQTLLTAQAGYQQALLSLLQARTNRYGDTAALFQALGGGWWNRPDADAAKIAPLASLATP